MLAKFYVKIECVPCKFNATELIVPVFSILGIEPCSPARRIYNACEWVVSKELENKEEAEKLLNDIKKYNECIEKTSSVISSTAEVYYTTHVLKVVFNEELTKGACRRILKLLENSFDTRLCITMDDDALLGTSYMPVEDYVKGYFKEGKCQEVCSYTNDKVTEARHITEELLIPYRSRIIGNDTLKGYFESFIEGIMGNKGVSEVKLYDLGM